MAGLATAYLTEKGIEKMRSKLTNEIFKDEMLSLYQRKDLSYKEVTQAAQDAMRELVQEMETSLCASPVIEQKMAELADALKDAKGKKVYGYLKKPVKKLVDEIVDELAARPAVAECYEVWNRLRDEVENYYKDTPREWLPLSQQKEFKSIKNMVIREAESIRLGAVTFEDEDMTDETWEEEETAPALQSLWQMAEVYRGAKETLYDEDATWSEMEKAVHVLEQLWDAGFTVAAHQLGKCYRDGLGVMPDDEKAEAWFRKSAEAGNDFAQYALGKLLQQEGRIEEAVEWYERASAQRNQYDTFINAVIVVSGMPYQEEQSVAAPSAPAPRPTPGTDYAANANPAVFTEELTRQAYNGIRNAILHREEIVAGTYPPIPIGKVQRNGPVEQVVSVLGKCPIYEIVKDENGEVVCNTRYVENYEPAREHTRSFIDGLAGLTDKEKAEKLVWYVCDRMTYEVKYPGPGKVLSQDGVVPGCCMAYSYAFQFLCDRAGIPCVLVCNDIHMWNQVYLDGQWWLVDVTASDAGDETAHRESSNYSPFYDIDTYWGASTVDGYPEITAFAKELLVPGSTK